MENIIQEKSDLTPFLQMRDISKSYSGVKVLYNVNLSVQTGEVLALVGENGAGKSTLIKTLAGAIKSDEGEILIQGKKVQFQTPLDAENKGIATVYQELNLFPYLTVTENLFFSSFHHRKGVIPWKKLHQEAQEFIETLGLHLRARGRQHEGDGVVAGASRVPRLRHGWRSKPRRPGAYRGDGPDGAGRHHGHPGQPQAGR